MEIFQNVSFTITNVNNKEIQGYGFLEIDSKRCITYSPF